MIRQNMIDRCIFSENKRRPRVATFVVLGDKFFFEDFPRLSRTDTISRSLLQIVRFTQEVSLVFQRRQGIATAHAAFAGCAESFYSLSGICLIPPVAFFTTRETCSRSLPTDMTQPIFTPLISILFLLQGFLLGALRTVHLALPRLSAASNTKSLFDSSFLSGVVSHCKYSRILRYTEYYSTNHPKTKTVRMLLFGYDTQTGHTNGQVHYSIRLCVVRRIIARMFGMCKETALCAAHIPLPLERGSTL